MRVPLWWAIGVAWPNTLAIAFEQRFARDRFSQKFPLQRPFFIAIVGTGRNMRKIASAAFFIAPLLAVAPALALDDLIPAGWQGKIAADSVCSDEKSLPQIAKFEADSGDAGSVLNCDYSLSAATGDVVTVVDSRKLLTTTGDDSTTYWEIHVRDRARISGSWSIPSPSRRTIRSATPMISPTGSRRPPPTPFSPMSFMAGACWRLARDFRLRRNMRFRRNGAQIL